MLRLMLPLGCAIALIGDAAEVVIVDLEAPDTLFALFESGLHPRRAYRNSGHSFLEIWPARTVGFKVKSRKIPPTKTVWRIIVGWIVVATGLLGLLLKKRKCPP